MINLLNAVYSTNTGGDYLLNQLLLFLSIMPSSYSKNNFTELKTVFYNFGVVAIFMQLFLVYSISGYAKLTDVDWQNGNAVAQISKCNHYSLFQINSLALSVVLSYTLIIYQLLFPLLVWFKTIKKWVLWFGLIMHVYIVLVIGLVSFGLLMIICYLLFFDLKFLQTKK